jgi:hypothetical protein
MKQLLQYVNPKGPLPTARGKGSLLVIGSGTGVWEDLRQCDQRHGDQDRLAVNDMMTYYPGRLQHGVSLHTDKLPGWTFGQYYRGAKAGWPPMQVHSHQPSDQVQHVWPLTREGGTSGLFGVLIGLLMGYERIILAGIPCDDSPRFFDPPWQLHTQFGLETVHQEWLRVRDGVPLFKERVRSLSGNTAKWLGKP